MINPSDHRQSALHSPIPMSYASSDMSAVSIRDTRPMEARFVCRCCKKIMVSETRYLAHNCKFMKKEEELKSPNGQAALHYYQLWMRQLKRTPPPANSFLASKFFRTFVNFVKFVKSVGLPQPDKFIWLMTIVKKYQPIIWMRDDVYVDYLEYLDRNLDPLEQAQISIDTLLNYADRNDIDTAVVFDTLHPADLIQMIRLRKLSPWLLLFSKKFKLFFANKTNAEQKIMLEALIQPSYWESKMAQFPTEIVSIKKCVAALDL